MFWGDLLTKPCLRAVVSCPWCSQLYGTEAEGGSWLARERRYFSEGLLSDGL